MLYETYTYEGVPVSYIRSHPQPSLLIASGFHGDESESIPLIERVIDDHAEAIQPFLFIPRVSPSSVALKTRLNKDNIDINRSFTGNGVHPEASAIITFLKPFSFELALAFHEDPQMDSFYLYDSGDRRDMDCIHRMLRAVGALGIPLFSGIDDPDDPTLGLTVENGYIGIDEEPGHADTTHGFFNTYLLAAGKAKRVITFEVPGIVQYNTKKKIVGALFRELLLKGGE